MNSLCLGNTFALQVWRLISRFRKKCLRTKNTTVARTPRPTTATVIPMAAPEIDVLDDAPALLMALPPGDGLADAAEEEDKGAMTVSVT